MTKDESVDALTYWWKRGKAAEAQLEKLQKELAEIRSPSDGSPPPMVVQLRNLLQENRWLWDEVYRLCETCQAGICSAHQPGHGSQ